MLHDYKKFKHGKEVPQEAEIQYLKPHLLAQALVHHKHVMHMPHDLLDPNPNYFACVLLLLFWRPRYLVFNIPCVSHVCGARELVPEDAVSGIEFQLPVEPPYRV